MLAWLQNTQLIHSRIDRIAQIARTDIFVFERRAGENLTFTGAYTWSKMMDNINNPIDSYATREELDTVGWQRNNFPQCMQLTYVYGLPFGRGKQFANSISPLEDSLVGGWVVSGVTWFRSAAARRSEQVRRCASSHTCFRYTELGWLLARACLAKDFRLRWHGPVAQRPSARGIHLACSRHQCQPWPASSGKCRSQTLPAA